MRTPQPGSADSAAAPSTDRWTSGGAYERYMGRWSRQLALELLRWLAQAPGRRWLDVGCGTGALSAAILAEAAPNSVTGVDPSAGFIATASERLGDRVAWQVGKADQLPLPDASVDVTVASLVLNFVPDAAAALREMSRVTVAGGEVAACVWDYAERMQMIRLYWDVVAELDRGDGAPRDQGERFPICRPDALAAAFGAAGLQQVSVAPLEISTRFADFDDYWTPFLGGQGPAPAHAMSLDEPTRERLREALRLRMQQRHPAAADGSHTLVARAWAARGTVLR